MTSHNFPRKKIILTLWLLGTLAASSILPVIPQMVAQLGGEAELPMPIGVLQLISFVQTAVLILISVVIGALLSPKVGLTAPTTLALVNRQPIKPTLLPQLIPGIIGGVIGGVLILAVAGALNPSLPTDFLVAAKTLHLPLYSRIFYGGITEEILLRWGAMTLLVWLFSLGIKHRSGEIHLACYVLGTLLSSLLFAVGHLPLASLLAETITPPLLAYVLLANGLFGLVAGYLYWKKGLESAMIAHITAHLVMYAVNG